MSNPLRKKTRELTATLPINVSHVCRNCYQEFKCKGRSNIQPCECILIDSLTSHKVIPNRYVYKLFYYCSQECINEETENDFEVLTVKHK